MKKEIKNKLDLLELMNVGKATLRDLEMLGISNTKELSEQNADELYERIQRLTGTKHDPCVWDVFAAIIHEAKTGEKTPWWKWTKIRKDRERTKK